jgi:hypothetical protein
VWFAAAILAFFFVTTSSVWTQVAPPGVLVGPTLAASLRNAAAATKDQAIAVQSTALNWARRASSAHYRAENLEADIRTMYLQFHGLSRTLQLDERSCAGIEKNLTRAMPWRSWMQV